MFLVKLSESRRFKIVMYQGFEDLVDVDDDPADYIPEHIQSAVQSLRQALEKTMILPDIYKPVCNSERVPRKHKYRSCKVLACAHSARIECFGTRGNSDQ